MSNNNNNNNNNKVQQLIEVINNIKNKRILKYTFGIGLIGLGVYLIYKKYISKSQILKSLIYNGSKNNHNIINLEIEKQIQIFTVNKFSFTFNVLKHLDKKPIQNQNSNNNNPFLPPFEKGLFLQEIQNNYNLIYNKYAVIKNHMLLTTKEFQPQSTLLSESDFSAANEVNLALQGFYFYNSGQEAGGSQNHKHIQIMPKEALKNSPILTILKQKVNRLFDEDYLFYTPFKFTHIIKVLDKKQKKSSPEYGSYLHKCYIDSMEILKNLKKKDKNIIKKQYNLIVTDNFMMIILRKQNNPNSFPNISINAIPFTGSFLLKSDQDIKQISIDNTDFDPYSLLEDVTFPFPNDKKLFRLMHYYEIGDIAGATPYPSSLEFIP